MTEPHSGRPALTARRIVAVYMVVSVAWILLSDRIVVLLFPSPEAQALIQTVKGWLFVAVTAGLLLGLLVRFEAAYERQAAAIARGERTFRLLADHARDIIFRYRISPTVGIDYVSPSVETLLGYPPGAFQDEPGLLGMIIHPDDAGIFPVNPEAVPGASLSIVRFMASDGRWVPFETSVALATDTPDGSVTIEGVARDVSDRLQAEREIMRANRALRTLSAANRALVRSSDEESIVSTICQAIVEEGGYRFAWAGAVDPETGMIRPLAHAGVEDGYLSAVGFSAEDVPTGRGPSGTAVREARTVLCSDIATDPIMGPWRRHALERGYASSVALPLKGKAGIFGSLAIYSAEIAAFGAAEVSLLEELADDLGYGLEVLRDRQAHAAGERERHRLATAFTQASESLVITDADGTIEYVNPAFELITGYRRDEVIGQNPRILKSGAHPPEFYESMWQTLVSGQPWAGDLVNRRKDGSLFTEEVVISPVVDSSRVLTGYVAVKRDVSRERTLEERTTALARERTLIAETLRGLRSTDSLEVRAQAICSQVLNLDLVADATVWSFDGDGPALPLAHAHSVGARPTAGPLSLRGSRELRSRAQAGPWLTSPAADESMGGPRSVLGPGRSQAAAPIRHDGAVIGVLTAGAAQAVSETAFAEVMPALIEFADLAGAIVGRDLHDRTEARAEYGRVRSVIATRAFWPVFQPIFDIQTDRLVGYEALTRFADQSAPDLTFAAADAVGLGLELERATLEASIAASAQLGPDTWLNLNVSPALILAREPLATLLAPVDRTVVLEVTEHAAITDYEAFRSALSLIRPGVLIAIDDAGAGFASLRHILELRPRFVKLDRWLVAGIEADTARQAMVAGLAHFARSTDIRLIAEGIETDAELTTLQGLEVDFGQGYLLGRPARVDEPRPVR